jgi:hypothetical protein
MASIEIAQNANPGLRVGNPGYLLDGRESGRRSTYMVFRFSAADLPVLRSTTTSKETR